MNAVKRVDGMTRRNWLVDAVLLSVALAAVLTGVYFLFLPVGGYQGGRNAAYGLTLVFSRQTWSDLHAWSGALMIAVAALHVVLHWSWIVSTARRIARGARSGAAGLSRGSKVNLAVNAAIALSFTLAAVSGVYFLFAPAVGYQGGSAAGWDPGFLMARTTWDAIHTWSGVMFVVAVMLHLAIHWRWIEKVTTRLLQSAPRPGMATREVGQLATR